MNPLPQRKKTPEEIAKLRESLGVPVDPALAGSDAGDFAPGPSPEAESTAATLEQAPPIQTPPTQHSLKRSERIPQLHAGPILEPVAPVLSQIERLQTPEPVAPVSPVAVPHLPKPIRSLKRSEREAAPVKEAMAKPIPADSKLPVHRHSDQEIADIRRRDAVSVIAQGGFELPVLAPIPLLIIGYLLAIGGAAAPTLLDLISRLTDSYTMGNSFGGGYHLLTGCTLAALPIAAFIFIKKTLSRHHAAFITIIVFFALVFAVVHYLPLLRNAT
jgi:hypothetical protein